MQRRSTLAEDTNNEQIGRLEVRVTIDNVTAFEPTFKTLGEEEYPFSYEKLAKDGMPPMAFIGSELTPLPDIPEVSPEGSPVLAVQCNFISGGVIVAIYLHHSVGGVQALSSLMRCMSISEDVLPNQSGMTDDSLREQALEQNRLRDRLSGSRGCQASIDDHPVYKSPKTVSDGALVISGRPACHVLAFSPKMLDMARDLANEHFSLIKGDPTVRLSRFDCLLSIVWKALIRARWPRGAAAEGQTSALVVPINIRARVEPALNAAYIGNSDLFSYTESEVCKLGLPFDVSTIANTAYSVRKSLSGLTEPKVRSAIAIINECEDVRSINSPSIDVESDFFVTNWADFPISEETTLGMGLGPAEWSRKLSRDHAHYDCVLLPFGRARACEVSVQLAESEMELLITDPGLKPFLLGNA